MPIARCAASGPSRAIVGPVGRSVKEPFGAFEADAILAVERDAELIDPRGLRRSPPIPPASRRLGAHRLRPRRRALGPPAHALAARPARRPAPGPPGGARG